MGWPDGEYFLNLVFSGVIGCADKVFEEPIL